MASEVLIILFITITLVSAAPIYAGIKINPLAILSTTGLIKKYGYTAETHSVTTEDGYILELHRIPYSPKSPHASKKPPVLLVHGLAGSSADWVLLDSENGFDLGYDVWLGNSRGNIYSRKHVTLNPRNLTGPFWNFSWHEMGMYDIPALIDYILKITGQPKLFYIGYSQGTTQFYVMASERPEYNDKIRAMFSFAPVAYMSHAEGPVLKIFTTRNGADKLEELLGVRSFLQHTSFNVAIGQVFCSDGSATQLLCEYLLFFIFGFDQEQLNATVLPVSIAHNPAGVSTKQLFHYGQEVASRKFRRYDYGRQGNLDLYGMETPPDYDLGKVTAPVSLHYASNDWLASTVDVNQLFEELGNPIGKFLVPHPKFNHIDFFSAIDVKTLVFNQVTALMTQY